MRIVGIDLGITGKHKAVIADERGRAIRPVLSFSTSVPELAHLVEAAQEGKADRVVKVVMEPTGMAWFPVAVYLARQGWTIYLVNSRQVADLRRFMSRYAKSDRIDAGVLVKLPVIQEETLTPFALPSATAQACRRACKQRSKLDQWSTAILNRVTEIDSFAWPGLQGVFKDPFCPAARWFRQHSYDPGKVVAAGASGLRQSWQASKVDPKDTGEWIEALVALAKEIVELYGADAPYLDWTCLQAEIGHDLSQLALFEQLMAQVEEEQIQPLYHQLHPSGNLESLYGVGPDGAAVYASFMGNASRFPTLAKLRGWSGLVPKSSQSASSEASGLSITQAGPALIKKFAYLNADVARRYDPQIAAIYYHQMVHKNKHHDQAVCACATHLLGRLRAVLRENRPYELRDVDGTPVTKEQARQIIKDQYTVPQEVRQRNNKRARQERAKQRAERKLMKESPTPS